MRYISLADFKKLKNIQQVNFDYREKSRIYIHGISIDSRSIKNSDIFWAIKGENFDGHNYVPDSIKKGAAAIVIQSKFAAKYKSLDIPVIVVDDTLKALQNFAKFHRSKYKIPVIGI